MTKPKIEGARGKMAVLERRCEHLKRRLARNEYTSSASSDFDRAEAEALTAAIQALDYVAGGAS